jgi:hypothetical protein
VISRRLATIDAVRHVGICAENASQSRRDERAHVDASPAMNAAGDQLSECRASIIRFAAITDTHV